MPIEFDLDLLARDAFSQGLTATKFAKRARVSTMTVSRFLRGKTRSPRTAQKLARALGFEIDRYLPVVATGATPQPERGAMKGSSPAKARAADSSRPRSGSRKAPGAVSGLPAKHAQEVRTRVTPDAAEVLDRE